MGNVVKFVDVQAGDLTTVRSVEGNFVASGEVRSVGYNPFDQVYQISMMHTPTKKLVFSSDDYEIVKHSRPLKFPEPERFLKFRVLGHLRWNMGIWDGRQFVGMMPSGHKVSVVSSFESVEWDYVEGV